jgi:hypothetical protein
MATDNKCVDYARKCVRLAGLTQDPQIRIQLLSMAGEWMTSEMHEQGPTERASATPQKASLKFYLQGSTGADLPK